MKITVYGVPSYRVTFTRTLVAALSSLASGHYDATCRGLVTRASDVPGSVNGLLTILQQSFYLLGQNEIEYNLSFRDLDILAKLTEMPLGHVEKTAARLIQQFRSVAYTAVRRSNEYRSDWFTVDGEKEGM